MLYFQQFIHLHRIGAKKYMSFDKKLEWTLRVGIAAEFIGHGVLAIQGKASWIKWISMITGAEAQTAATLLLLVGIMDVAFGLLVLVRPWNPALLWMTFWGFWTALVRPIVGESWLDFVERGANWAAPLALFFFYKAKK